ncbi:BTAD domain-containing putative transcriptional regulator [Nocardia sp. NPDC006630]|uniref:ATP-binding protein n=1 Tax=Nocardia sp. NPDC006630 TaxID=3157181 RepID=UPI0033A00798
MTVTVKKEFPLTNNARWRAVVVTALADYGKRVSIELTLLSGVAVQGREVSGARPRGLLALLAADLRNGASVARLVDGLWGQEQPENPAKALQVVVSRARAQLGSELIASTHTGYRLTLAADQVDATAVEVHAAAAERHARAGDHAAALTRAEAGLALWNGDAEDGTAGDPLSELRIARRPAHRTLRTVHAVTLSQLGRYAEAMEPLAALLRAEPRNEEVLAELLRAEAETAGAAAALARYDGYRRRLRDELGTDPGSALRAVQRQLLLSSEPVVRQGILHDANPLLGRAGDIAAVTARLRSARVVSIVGPGGLGKTRMAHAVGQRAEQRRVYLVQLAAVDDDAAVAAEVAAALGTGDAPAAAQSGVVSGIARALGSGPVLLILDNCEQVLEGVAALVGPLVSLTAELRVLVTSRAPLGLSSESVHPLPALAAETAAELFEQRARAVRPDVDLPSEEVAALCAHLDGLPLAIELAAARVRVMSVAEVSQRLVDRFALLRGGSRDAPQRHRTLHAVVEWSWKLLDEPAQAAMRMLSIFPGGCTADAAHRLLGGDFDATLELLEQLVTQSLIQVGEGESGTRFRMLETVRDFSAAERIAAGDEDRATAEFLAWARDFGIRHSGSAFIELGGSGEFRAEQDNLVRALRIGLDRRDGATVAATWAVLGPAWFVGSHYSRIAEQAAECAWVLSHYRPEPALVEVARTAAVVCALSGVTQGGFELRSRLVLRRLPTAPPDTFVRAVAAVFAAATDLVSPDPTALNRLCDSDSRLLSGVAHLVASFRAEQIGDRAEALAATTRTLAAFETTSNTFMRYQARCRIGKLALLAERGDQAREQLERALRQIADLGPRPDRGDLLVGLAMAALQLDDIEGAQQWLALTPESKDPFANPHRLVAAAEIRLARSDVENGLRGWRELAEWSSGTENPFYRPDPRGVQVWALESRSATVLAHAEYGRLALVADLVEDLPHQVTALLEQPATQPGGFLAELTACGAVLLALARADIARGHSAAGARLIALAERFDPPRQFHPTMSSTRIRAHAENADKAAYAEAVSAYAALDVPALRAAALNALRDRVS